MIKGCIAKYNQYVSFLERYLSSVLFLAIRIWIGLIFFKSGLLKISNIDETISLFADQYNVPILSPEFAASLSILFEIGCGLFIIAGFLTRLAVLPLIGMTLVIQIFVFHNPEHFYWLFLFSTLAIFGSGKASLDYFLHKVCAPRFY